MPWTSSICRSRTSGMTFTTEERPLRRAARHRPRRGSEGEFVTLIGHSGCGKSHAAQPDRRPDHAHRAACCCCDDREIAGPGPERGVVFQNHSLLPWLTCFDNVYLAVERVFGDKRRQGAS
ncbi:MAG: hypothetical protein MZW92_79950 [Comamonadaceae bacterium]|nr:hypothetical protein [Comamonadaceae bacterium]